MFDLSALKGWFGSNPAAFGPLKAQTSAVSPTSPFGMGAAANAFKQTTFVPTGMQAFGQRLSGALQDPRTQLGLSMLGQNGAQGAGLNRALMLMLAKQGGLFGRNV